MISLNHVVNKLIKIIQNIISDLIHIQIMIENKNLDLTLPILNRVGLGEKLNDRNIRYFGCNLLSCITGYFIYYGCMVSY